MSVTRTLEVGPNDISGIIAAIRQLREAGGELPSERDMAVQLNVKRYQLRKALEQLRKSGDIAPSRRTATGSRPRHNEDLVRVTNPIEVIELRLILEPSFARLASLRASSLDIAQISQWATTQSGDDPDAVGLSFSAYRFGRPRCRLAHQLRPLALQLSRAADHGSLILWVLSRRSLAGRPPLSRLPEGTHGQMAALRGPSSISQAERVALLATQGPLRPGRQVAWGSAQRGQRLNSQHHGH